MHFGLIGKSLSHLFSKSYLEENLSKKIKQIFNTPNFDLDNLDNLIANYY